VIDYPDDARLTLGELAEWSEQEVSSLQALERKGVISRGPDGLFTLLPTIKALADHAEFEERELRRRYKRTAKGWFRLIWNAPASGLFRLWRGFEMALGRALNRLMGPP